MTGWVGHIGSAGVDFLTATEHAMDSSGNLYIAGSFSQTVDFDFGAGVSNLTASGGNTDGFVAKYTPNGGLLWVKRFDAAARSIVLDGSAAYFAGSYQGSADFTGDAITDVKSVGADDGFVVKLDANTGTTMWFKSFGGSSSDYVRDIAIAEGYVYSAGYFRGTTDFDPSAGTFKLTSNGTTKRASYEDAFVQKLDANGNFVTAWQIGSDKFDAFDSLVVDSGAIYLAGQFTGTVDFDRGSNVVSRTSVGQDRFLASYTTNGTFSWVQTFGLASGNEWQIAKASGSLIITGAFSGTMDADPGAGVLSLNAGLSGTDAFVGMYTQANGSVVWARDYGTTTCNDSAATQALVDELTGNIYVGGTFAGSIDFELSGPSGELVSAGGVSDGFLLKLSSDGEYLNAWRMGGTGADGAPRPIGVRSDSSGTTVYASGWFDSPVIDLPTGSTLSNAGSQDIFVMALDEVLAATTSPTATGVSTASVNDAALAQYLSEEP